jgi:DNA-binding XRE family transcriptional regulator
MWDQVSEFLFDHFTIAGFPQIRAARGLLGWTRHELARRAIVSDATLYALENARGTAANPSTLAAVQRLKPPASSFLTDLPQGCDCIPNPVMTPPNRNRSLSATSGCITRLLVTIRPGSIW